MAKYATTIPVVVTSPSGNNAIRGRRIILIFWERDSTGALTGDPKFARLKSVNFGSSIEELDFEATDTNGIRKKFRSDVVSQDNSLSATIDEFVVPGAGDLANLLNTAQFLSVPQVKGYAQILVLDPQGGTAIGVTTLTNTLDDFTDERVYTGTARVSTSVFKCSIQKDGDTTFDPDTYAEMTLNFKVEEDTAYPFDVKLNSLTLTETQTGLAPTSV